MTDVFLSYSSKDRARVERAHQTLKAAGFDVFMDISTPTAVEWDEHIRSHLEKARCVLVFWSRNSAASVNVKHEAIAARDSGKLIPAMLEPLTANQLPMGMYLTQMAQLAEWNGAADHPEWQKLTAEIEARTLPEWVRRRLASLSLEVKTAQSRLREADLRASNLEVEHAREVERQGVLRRERDRYVTDLAERTEQLEKTQLRALESERSVTVLQDQAVKLQNEIQSLSELTRSLTEQGKSREREIASLKQKIDVAKATESKLLNETESIRKELAAKSSELDFCQDGLASSAADLDAATVKCNELLTSQLALKADADELRLAKQKISEKLLEESRQNQLLKEQFQSDAMGAKIVAQRAQLGELTDHNRQLMKKLTSADSDTAMYRRASNSYRESYLVQGKYVLLDLLLPSILCAYGCAFAILWPHHAVAVLATLAIVLLLMPTLALTYLNLKWRSMIWSETKFSVTAMLLLPFAVSVAGIILGRYYGLEAGTIIFFSLGAIWFAWVYLCRLTFKGVFLGSETGGDVRH